MLISKTMPSVNVKFLAFAIKKEIDLQKTERTGDDPVKYAEKGIR